MKKTYSVLIVCIFVLFLAAVSVGSVVAPERTFYGRLLYERC